MPLYEYICKDCGKEFEELVSSSEAKNPPCPSCGSDKCERKFSLFASSFGNGGLGSVSTGGGCGHGGFT